jgi:hypothetical protein
MNVHHIFLFNANADNVNVTYQFAHMLEEKEGEGEGRSDGWSLPINKNGTMGGIPRGIT